MSTLDLPARCGVCYGLGWAICIDGPRLVCFMCHGTGLADQNAAPAPPTYTEVERLDRPGNRANLDARN